MVIYKKTGLKISEVGDNKDLCIEAKEVFCKHEYDLTNDFVLREETPFRFENKDVHLWFPVLKSDVITASKINGRPCPNIKIVIVAESETGETLKSLIEPRGIKT